MISGFLSQSVSVALAALFAAGIVAGQKPEAAPKAAVLKVSKEGRAALDGARKLLAAIKGTKGIARKSIQEKAAAAYEAVASEFVKEPATVARASFDAAELWRRAGATGKAADGYRRAMRADPNRYQERSTLELAHLARRQKAMPEAIKLYRAVVALATGSARQHQAGMWVGRSYESLGKRKEAEAAYRVLLKATKAPRRLIDVCNRLGNLLIKSGRLQEANEVVQQADAAVEGFKGTPRKTKSLRKALQKMSARRAMQRAADKKNDAAKDAEELDKRRQ